MNKTNGREVAKGDRSDKHTNRPASEWSTSGGEIARQSNELGQKRKKTKVTKKHREQEEAVDDGAKKRMMKKQKRKKVMRTKRKRRGRG